MVSYSPLLFRFANQLEKAQIRGSTRLMNLLAACGALDVVAHYPLGKFSFSVPLWRNRMELEDLQQYESDLIELFCSRLTGLQDVVLFDCGADIGVFSAVICARSQALSRIIAFEPNEDAVPYLKDNMDALPIQAEAVGSAVSNFTGRGKLESPGYDQGHTARFLVPGDGPISVTTIDSFNVLGKNVAIKIDVEGGELEVLKGASETIRSAAACVIAIEAHPSVAKRTGRDPVECLRLLHSLRPFQSTVAETGEDLSLERPVIQPGQAKVHNIVCATA